MATGNTGNSFCTLNNFLSSGNQHRVDLSMVGVVPEYVLLSIADSLADTFDQKVSDSLKLTEWKTIFDDPMTMGKWWTKVYHRCHDLMLIACGLPPASAYRPTRFENIGVRDLIPNCSPQLNAEVLQNNFVVKHNFTRAIRRRWSATEAQIEAKPNGMLFDKAYIALFVLKLYDSLDLKLQTLKSYEDVVSEEMFTSVIKVMSQRHEFMQERWTLFVKLPDELEKIFPSSRKGQLNHSHSMFLDNNFFMFRKEIKNSISTPLIQYKRGTKSTASNRSIVDPDEGKDDDEDLETVALTFEIGEAGDSPDGIEPLALATLEQRLTSQNATIEMLKSKLQDITIKRVKLDENEKMLEKELHAAYETEKEINHKIRQLQGRFVFCSSVEGVLACNQTVKEQNYDNQAIFKEMGYVLETNEDARKNMSAIADEALKRIANRSAETPESEEASAAMGSEKPSARPSTSGIERSTVGDSTKQPFKKPVATKKQYSDYFNSKNYNPGNFSKPSLVSNPLLRTRSKRKPSNEEPKVHGKRAEEDPEPSKKGKNGMNKRCKGGDEAGPIPDSENEQIEDIETVDISDATNEIQPERHINEDAVNESGNCSENGNVLEDSFPDSADESSTDSESGMEESNQETEASEVSDVEAVCPQGLN